MTTKHTPGPWRVHPYRNHMIGKHNKAIDVGPYGLTVATVIGAFEKTEAGPEAEANAALIAAAPDMLDVVRDYADVLDYYIRKDEHGGDLEGSYLKRFALSRVNATIAKAEGRS